MKAALAVLTALSAVWHVHVPVLAVPVPVMIAGLELAALAGLAVLAARAVRRFQSAPWPRQPRPVPAGGAW